MIFLIENIAKQLRFVKFVLFVFKKIFVFKNHSCSPLIASVIRVLINIREIRAIRVQKRFVFKNPFVFEIQKSSRHTAHHAEAAGDGCEHGNDEIDDSFQGFLFHSFIFFMFTFFFVSFVFFFLQFPFRSLWKRQNDQMTKWPHFPFSCAFACWGFKDNRDNRDNF